MVYIIISHSNVHQHSSRGYRSQATSVPLQHECHASVASKALIISFTTRNGLLVLQVKHKSEAPSGRGNIGSYSLRSFSKYAVFNSCCPRTANNQVKGLNEHSQIVRQWLECSYCSAHSLLDCRSNFLADCLTSSTISFALLISLTKPTPVPA